MKRKFWYALGAVVLCLAAFGVGIAAAGSGNDTVFKEHQYRKFYKQEGNGKKNYLYTITEQNTPARGKCLIVTAASETAVAIYCTP